jgi:hypothetical protein
MSKKDPIFWGAASIFVLAIALFAVTQNQLWLALLVGSYLLRPTLASLGIAKKLVDERQMSIQYRSGNIGFAVMIVACIVLAVNQSIKNDPSWEMFTIILALGLAAKALVNVVLVGSYRDSGSKIIMAAGALIALFASFELGNGFSIGVLAGVAPGLAIVGIGWLARKFPRSIGGTIFAITAVLLYVILAKGFTTGQITSALVVAVPLVTAGFCLIVGDRKDSDAEDGPTGAIRSGPA